MNIDIQKLRDDLKGLEDIENFSNDKLIEIAKENGFNLEFYEIELFKKSE